MFSFCSLADGNGGGDSARAALPAEICVGPRKRKEKKNDCNDDNKKPAAVGHKKPAAKPEEMEVDNADDIADCDKKPAATGPKKPAAEVDDMEVDESKEKSKEAPKAAETEVDATEEKDGESKEKEDKPDEVEKPKDKEVESEEKASGKQCHTNDEKRKRSGTCRSVCSCSFCVFEFIAYFRVGPLRYLLFYSPQVESRQRKARRQNRDAEPRNRRRPQIGRAHV